MVTLDDAARLALGLPDVAEGERHGTRTWQVHGKTFAWERSFSKADLRRYGDVVPPAGPIVAVRVADLEEKEAILATRRRGLFTIPHFDGYAAVLIHLKVVGLRVLRDTITDGWLCCAPPELVRRFLGEE